MKEDIQLKVAENFKKEAYELKAELAKIEKAIAERDMEKGRSILLAKIEEKRVQAKLAENNDKKCSNFAELDRFAGEAKKVSTVAAIKRISDGVDQWAPKFTMMVVPKVEPPKPVVNSKKADQ